MKPIRIVITTGDIDGIGTEVASKALAKIKPSKKVRYLIWRSPSCPRSHLRKMENNFERITVHSWDQALGHDHDDYKSIIDISSDLSPAQWVETTAKAALYGHIDAIVTAPLSKTSILAAGLNDIGHTDILKRVAKKKDVFMAFWGDKMRVILATGHIPVQQVSEELTTNKLMKALRAAKALSQSLDKKVSKKPIGLLGLNPHAGEGGVIGKEEKSYHQAALKKAEAEKISVEGPLVPDVCFQSTELKKYSIYVANYHDQGLIPFKMLHDENRGVHLSLGLPFIRTSVDHGTAKDIFNKNKANYYSMLEAIKLATKIASTDEIRNNLKNL
jgi:4-hydroxythreonine-4-phosphate dehydrogenase